MASAINKKILENLEELARMKINPARTEKLLNDLEKILGHFSELKELDTQNVLPMTGGTFSKNVFRDDGESGKVLDGNFARTQFPEKQNGFLKIPPVFSAEGGE